jgi:hypothetical protein
MSKSKGRKFADCPATLRTPLLWHEVRRATERCADRDYLPRLATGLGSGEKAILGRGLTQINADKTIICICVDLRSSAAKWHFQPPIRR